MNRAERERKRKSRIKEAQNQKRTSEGLAQTFKKRAKFRNFADLAEYAKGMVYLLVRIRSTPEGDFYSPLGTGFLAGPHRLVTCEHCINSSDTDEPLGKHLDGDMYLFIQKDEDGNFHRYGLTDVTLNKQLHLYPDLDFAIFDLPDDFYKVDGEYYKSPEAHLEFSASPCNIGHDTAILGYPLPKLDFDDKGIPDLEGVYIRGDKGVVNTRYIKNGVEAYEFTTPFNPGNSGGPIFELATGKVIGMVFAYNPIPINFTKDMIPAGTLGISEDVEQVSVIRTTYSIGVSSRNYQHLVGSRGLAML